MNKNTKVLFVIPGFELGGAERQALYLASHLKRNGFEVSFIGFFGPGKVSAVCDDLHIPWQQIFFRWPCRLRTIPRSIIGTVRFIFSLWQIKPNIIIGYCPWACTITGWTWKLSSAKGFIWSQRDSGDLRGDFIQKFAFKQATTVICNADHEINYLKDTFQDDSKQFHVIYNGIDLPEPVKTRQEWRQTLGINMSTLVFVKVANFRRQKNHSDLLHAWANFCKQNQHILLLAGAFQESYHETVELTKKLGIENSVKFLGQIDDITGLLNASDVGILATHHEGLPNAIIEYMSCGLPVIATDLPSTREVLGENYPDQVYSAADLQELLSKLILFTNNSEKRKQLGKENYLRSQNHFKIERMCNQSLAVIEQL